MNKNNNKLQIRNSTAEILIFTSQSGENSIDVMVVDKNSVCRKFRRTGADGKEYNTKFYINNSEKITAEIAKAFAESEYEKYRIVQDRVFENDFDRLLREAGKGGEGLE